MTAPRAGQPALRASVRYVAEPPVLGLLGGPSAPGLRELLAALAERCVPRYVDPVAAARTAANIATADGSRFPLSRPYALWLRRPEDVDSGLAGGARVLLTHDPALVREADGAGPVTELVPTTPPPAGHPVGPEVRARLRTARGLGEAPIAVFEQDTWSWGESSRPVDADLADTLCAVAAAVVASTPAAAILAMSWGAPTVTDVATAEQLGATDAQHLVVAGTSSERRRAAEHVARDQRLAARLSRGGRELVEERHDVVSIARRVGDRLGLPTRGAGPGAVLDHALDILGTPPSAPVRSRVAAALAGFPTYSGGATS